MLEKLQREPQQGVAVRTDSAGYKTVAEKAQKSFETRLAKDNAAAKS